MPRPDEPTAASGVIPPIEGEARERPGTVRLDERRRLLRGGLAVGPVILSIASRPVLGQSLNCGSAQVQASLQAGTSLHAGCAIDPYNTGLSPSKWYTTATWPAPYSNVSPKTNFIGIDTGLAGTAPTPNTMYAVLKGNASGLADLALAQDIVAALLNAAAGKTPFLTTATIQQMWNSYVSFGYYQVSPNIKWYPTQLKSYLQSTWT